MGTLNDRIKELEKLVASLQSKISDLSQNTEDKVLPPYSVIGSRDKSQTRNTDIKTGLGQMSGGNVPFNDSELQLPPYGQQPQEPTKGYLKHGHGRYSGGALDIHTLELVEYITHSVNKDSLDYPIILDKDGNPLNKQCQQFWTEEPPIVKENNVEKIGLLDISFDTKSKKWVTGSKEIDVEGTYLIQYAWYKNGVEVPEGTVGATLEIKTDENENEMKSSLLSEEGDEEENKNKTNVVWDKDAQVWRFYAVYSD